MIKEEKDLSTRKKILFSGILSILIPVIFLLILEGVLQIVNYGYPSSFFLKQKINGKEYFVENKHFTKRFFPEGMARSSAPFRVPTVKEKGSFRIFILGESAAMGDPDHSFSFSRILESILKTKYPEKQIEIYNTGITAINSHVLIPIAQSCSRLQPDLFIVYAGNNEVVGPFGPTAVLAPFMKNRFAIKSYIILSSTKTWQLVKNFTDFLKGDKNENWQGMEMFLNHQIAFNDRALDLVYNNFENNLAEIIKISKKCDAKMIITTVAVNLKDCPPFTSLHKSDIDRSQIARWEKYFLNGTNSTSPISAIENFSKAIATDPYHAETHYRLAQCYISTGQYKEAKHHYTLARDYDALRFRADSKINKVIRRSIQNTSEKITFIDVEKEFDKLSPLGTSGDFGFYEHVHFNFTGNFLLASLVEPRLTEIIGIPSISQKIISKEHVKKLLAFTKWEENRIEKEILQRFKNPPFTHQQLNNIYIAKLEDRMASYENGKDSISLINDKKEYETCLKNNPKDWVVRNNYGRFLLKAMNQPTEAEVQYRKITYILPYETIAINNLALSLTEQKKYAEAESFYLKALQIDPDFKEAHYNYGLLLLEKNQLEEAKKQLELSGMDTESSAEVQNSFGINKAINGNLKEAIYHFNQAIKINPQIAEYYYNLAKAYSEINEKESAMQNFEKAFKLQPKNKSIGESYVLFLIKWKMFAEAEQKCREILKINPDFAVIHNNLGLALAYQKKIDESLPFFLNSIRLKPDLIDGYKNIANVYFIKGNPMEGINFLLKALKKDSLNAGLHNWIGKEYYRTGMTPLAVKHFELAVKINPELTEPRQYLKMVSK